MGLRPGPFLCNFRLSVEILIVAPKSSSVFLAALFLISDQGFDFSKMGFIMEFAENLILRLMEDPKERDRKFREHVYAMKDRCDKTKEMWNLPLRPYGFWTFEKHNSQLAWDAQISQAPGRRDPYDDLLQDGLYPSSSK